MARESMSRSLARLLQSRRSESTYRMENVPCPKLQGRRWRIRTAQACCRLLPSRPALSEETLARADNASNPGTILPIAEHVIIQGLAGNSAVFLAVPAVPTMGNF